MIPADGQDRFGELINILRLKMYRERNNNYNQNGEDVERDFYQQRDDDGKTRDKKTANQQLSDRNYRQLAEKMRPESSLSRNAMGGEPGKWVVFKFRHLLLATVALPFFGSIFCILTVMIFAEVNIFLSLFDYLYCMG